LKFVATISTSEMSVDDHPGELGREAAKRNVGAYPLLTSRERQFLQGPEFPIFQWLILFVLTI
jgi:hypothetical protein